MSTKRSSFAKSGVSPAEIRLASRTPADPKAWLPSSNILRIRLTVPVPPLTRSGKIVHDTFGITAQFNHLHSPASVKPRRSISEKQSSSTRGMMPSTLLMPLFSRAMSSSRSTPNTMTNRFKSDKRASLSYLTGSLPGGSYGDRL